MDLLARREYSKFELCCKLKAKGYAEHLIDDVLSDLAKENLQSDERFAESYVTMRAKRGFGPVSIANKLRERGIAEDIIDQFVNKNKNDEIWITRAREVWGKKFSNKIPTNFQTRAKQSKFLQYRGFNIEQIKSVFEN